MNLRNRASRHSVDVIMSLLLAIVAFGSIVPTPAILLAIKLNVFAIPIALFAPVFPYPWWVWYVIALLWASQLLFYAGTDVAGAFETVRSGVRFAVGKPVRMWRSRRMPDEPVPEVDIE